jgi:glycosyltransferase involved in cell wall biosynthesis
LYAEQLGIPAEAERRFTSWNATLASELANLSGVNLHVITRSRFLKHTQSIRDGALAITFLASSRLATGATLYHNLAWRTHKLLKEQKPHLVHGIGTEHIWPYAAVTQPLPSVVTVHGVMSEVVRKVHAPLLSRQRYFATLEKRVLRKAKNVIVISPYVEQALKAYLQGHRFFIENPIHERFFEAGATPALSKTVLFVGDTGERKSLASLLEGFSQIVSVPESQGWGISVVGPIVEGSHYELVKQILRERHLEDRVTFKGFLSPDMLAKEYQNAAVLAVTSIEETAPMCIGEAMAAGLPVVACRISGIPFMVKEQQSGLLYTKGDLAGLANSLRVLIQDHTRRETMGQQGREIAEKRWRPERIAMETLNVYRELLAKTRAPSSGGQPQS